MKITTMVTTALASAVLWMAPTEAQAGHQEAYAEMVTAVDDYYNAAEMARTGGDAEFDRLLLHNDNLRGATVNYFDEVWDARDVPFWLKPGLIWQASQTAHAAFGFGFDIVAEIRPSHIVCNEYPDGSDMCCMPGACLCDGFDACNDLIALCYAMEFNYGGDSSGGVCLN